MSDKFDFDEKQYQVFIRRLEQDFIITILIEMKGGYSGAQTSLVQLEPRDARNVNVEKGKYILKVCLTEDAEREKQKHAKAKENDFLGQYVPQLVAFISYNGISVVGILYQIAGEELLTRTTLQEILEQRQTGRKQHDFLIKQIEEVAGTILKWNFGATHIIETSDLLGSILQNIGKDRLRELEGRLKGITKNVNRSRIELIPLVEAPKYNPIYFLSNIDRYKGTTLRQMPYLIPIGLPGNLHLHGDLHPGNVIICKEDQPIEPFHLIDFASSCSGNVFFDLAYLETSIILNSRGGFHRLLDLEDWWDLEQLLISEYLPSAEIFLTANREALQRVLPIRHALDARIHQDGRRHKDDYWMAFLAASVEAALDLARKAYYDRSLQRVAFLIAISRFHHLIKLLDAIRTPLRGPMATIHWPGEKLSPNKNGRRKEGIIAQSNALSSIHEARAKIKLVWPNQVTQREALYDPWRIVDEIWGDLTGTSSQAVLLIGERRFGKSSFYNCVSGLFPEQGETLRAVRLNTLGFNHSAQSFAIDLLEKLYQGGDLPVSSIPYDNRGREFDSGSFFAALRLVAEKKKDMGFVVCIDEIDSTLDKALSIEDARTIVQILYRLQTGHILPVRLLLTANKPEVLSLLRQYWEGTGFVENIEIRHIPLCSETEMRELIKRFGVSVTFEEEALNRIFYYSGGQIYFIKLAVKLAVDTSGDQSDQNSGERMISGRKVDELMHAVITPTSNTHVAIRNSHTVVFETMENIYLTFFSKEEQQFMRLLTEARGMLRASNLHISEDRLVNVAGGLYRRNYISKMVSEEEKDQIYSWRIGIWQSFLKEYYQLKYQDSH